MATYCWKPGARHKVDAQAAGEELERLRTERNGRLDAHDVVEASRPADAPLHREFEWDDEKAAESWRVEQAGALIRHITVAMEEAADRPPIRAFVSVRRDEDRSYTSIEHAMSDESLRQQVVAQAWKELEAWRQRHAELIEFARIFTAMDQARGAE